MQPVVRVEQLRKVYTLGDEQVVALAGVDLTINAGEFVAVMGPSGSGKSTFMQIVGLLDSPTAGVYLFEGPGRRELDADERADIRSRRLGFVFQSYNLLSRTSALENVELPMVYAGVPERERRRIALEKMEIVGVAHLAEPQPQPNVGRTAAARRDRALARQQSRAHSRRRADRGARHQDLGRRDAHLHASSTTSEGITIMLVTHEPDVARSREAHRHVPRRTRPSPMRIDSEEGGRHERRKP